MSLTTIKSWLSSIKMKFYALLTLYFAAVMASPIAMPEAEADADPSPDVVEPKACCL